MTARQDQAIEFLSKYGLYHRQIDAQSVLQSLLDEMAAGLTPNGSSIPMIPAFIECSNAVPCDEPVVVMDAGGTNLRVCTVTFSKSGAYSIEHFSKYPMPGIAKQLSATEFFNTLADYLGPLMGLSSRIGFCFSYPSEISPNKDGKLLHWTKEVKVPDVVGQFIGAGLLKILAARGHGDKSIVIVNDTVAAMLAGKAFGDKRGCSDYVGYILGTGTNTAYIESNRNIVKCPDLDPTGSMAINLESGNFNKAPRSVFDERFDETTTNPGGQQFEKMISGAYLGPVALLAYKQAAKDGHFSTEGAKVVLSWQELSTVDMSLFLANPNRHDSVFSSRDLTNQDREWIYHIFAGIVERAALLAAINIAAPVISTDAGQSPLHPVCINIDGSTFYKTHRMEYKVQSHLETLLSQRGIHYETTKVENAPVVGAGIAGLIG